MSHAATLSAMTQQVADLRRRARRVAARRRCVVARGDAAHLTARDFSPAFFVVGLVTLLSLLFFARLDPAHGESMRG